MISEDDLDCAQDYAIESGYSRSSVTVMGREARDIYEAVLYGISVGRETPNKNMLVDFVHYCRLQEEKRGKKGGAEKFVDEFLKYKRKWEAK